MVPNDNFPSAKVSKSAGMSTDKTPVLMLRMACSHAKPAMTRFGSASILATLIAIVIYAGYHWQTMFSMWIPYHTDAVIFGEQLPYYWQRNRMPRGNQSYRNTVVRLELPTTFLVRSPKSQKRNDPMAQIPPEGMVAVLLGIIDLLIFGSHVLPAEVPLTLRRAPTSNAITDTMNAMHPVHATV